jgi:hypothetical protein
MSLTDAAVKDAMPGDKPRKLANGAVPGEAKKIRKTERLKRIEAEKNTFPRVAKDRREARRTRITRSTDKEVWANLERKVFPALGVMPIAGLSAKVLMDCLRQMGASGRSATPRKVNGVASSCFFPDCHERRRGPIRAAGRALIWL